VDLNKDELLVCVIEAFSGRFKITDIDTTSSTDSVRFSIDGHRLRATLRGDVKTVGNGVLISDITASLAELVLKPVVWKASNMKLAA